MAQQFQQPRRGRSREVYDEDTGSTTPSFYRPESGNSSNLGDTSDIDAALANNDKVMSSLPLSNKDISSLESSHAGGGQSTGADKKESSDIPFSKETGTSGSPIKRLRAKVSNLSGRAKAGIGGGIVTGTIGLGAFFSFGSLQAVHLSQILSLDQTANEKSSDIRMNALFRYARSGGALGETRVSYLGSKKFADTKAKLANIGVEFNDTKAFGTQKGIVIDTNKFPATKGLNREQARVKLASFYQAHGITPDNIKNVSGNKLYIDSRNLGISSARGIVNDTVGQLDKGKISTWTRARVIKKYYNLPSAFHPFKRVDAKITQNIAGRFEAKEREKARKAGREYKSSTLDSAKSGLKSKLSGGKAALGGALLVTAGMCLARSAADDAITFNREAIVVPQALEAVDRIAIGAQQQSGMDFAPEQLNAANLLMTDDEGRSIWESKALKAKTDPTTAEGEDLPWEYGQAFSESAGASTLKDLGGTTGAVACSPGGQIAQGLLGLILLAAAIPTGGGTAIAYGAVKAGGSVAAGVAIMIGLERLLTNVLKNDEIPEDISAPIKGNLLAYGSRELANINARAAGGVELSASESAIIDNQAAQSNRTEFQSKSFFARMFDARDYRSLTGKFIDKFSSPKQQLKNIATNFLNIGPAFASMMRGLTPSAQAAEAYNYGFNRYGIPDRILNNEAYDDPYDNADKVAALLSGGSGEGYIDRAKKCFGVEISQSGGMWTVIPEGDVNPNSSEYEDANCNDDGDPNWDRVILFIKDSSEMEAAACYLGEEDSCKNIGVTTEENVCSVESSTGVQGMPDWVKMPVITAPVGGPVNGNISAVAVNSKFPAAQQTVLNMIINQKDPDFIALNEISRESMAGLERYAPGYGAWREEAKDKTEGNPGQAIGNAFMWKKEKWTLLQSGRIKVVEDDKTIAQGKQVTWDRFAMWGVFKRKTDGAIVSFVSTHFPTNPSRHKPIGGQWGNPPLTRPQMYGQGMDILIQLAGVLGQHGPVIVGGDMNTHGDEGDWAAIPKMKAAGFEYTSENDVMHIFSSKGTKIIANNRVTGLPLNGDHSNGAEYAKIDMNGAGPGAIEGVSGTTTSSSGDCDETAGNVPYQNPVYNGSAPDPSVIRGEDGKYHVYATSRVHLVSDDLVHWDKKNDDWNVKGLPRLACYWAPDVAKVGSKYVLTFSGHSNGCFPPNNPEIYYAVGDSAGGPFQFKGGLGLNSAGFSIDSHIFADNDGKSWLFFGGGVMRVVQVKLEGETLKKVGSIKNNLFDRVNPGDPTVEGWWVTKKEGWYYLFYSYGGYQTKSGPNEYSVRIARSKNVDGPYSPRDQYKPFLLGKDPIHAPGNNSIATDDGGNDWIVYHGYYKNGSERVLMIDPIDWSGDGGWPTTDGPSNGKRQGPLINGAGSSGGSDSTRMTNDYDYPACKNFRNGGPAPGLECNGQCVDFVKLRLKKHIDRNKFQSLGNGHIVASGLGATYGYKVNHTPAVNSVVSWPIGGVDANGDGDRDDSGEHANTSAGHTAMVSRVNADGSIVVEETNAKGDGRYGTRTIPANVAKLLTYAHTEVDFK